MEILLLLTAILLGSLVAYWLLRVRSLHGGIKAYSEAQLVSVSHTTPGDLSTLDQDVRDALLDMMWAAWFASRAPRLQQTLFAAVGGDEYSALVGAQETSGDILKLWKVDQHLGATNGDGDARTAIKGLLDGLLIMHLPPRLERVVKANDAVRVRLANTAKSGVAGALKPAAAHEVAAVLALLVEVQPIGDGSKLARDDDRRGLTSRVLPDLGLPINGYDAIVDSWIAAA